VLQQKRASAKLVQLLLTARSSSTLEGSHRTTRSADVMTPTGWAVTMMVTTVMTVMMMMTLTTTCQDR
jgi:hypothetical protein